MLFDMCCCAGCQERKASAQANASVTMLSMLSQRPHCMSKALQALSALPLQPLLVMLGWHQKPLTKSSLPASVPSVSRHRYTCCLPVLHSCNQVLRCLCCVYCCQLTCRNCRCCCVNIFVMGNHFLSSHVCIHDQVIIIRSLQ